MNRRFFLSGLALAPFAPMLARAGAPPAGPDIAAASNALAVDLFGQVAADKSPFISPISISAALGMTLAGARGKTEREMLEVMHLKGSREQIGAGYAQLLDGLNAGAKTGGYKLRLANRLFANRATRFDAAFLAHNKTHFRAPVEKVNFQGDPEGSRKLINAWVEKQTLNRIKELLKPTVIRKDTRLVLTNAIWFKGDWSKAFDKRRTRPGAFATASGDQKTAQYMWREDRMRAASFDEGMIAALPYGKSERARMLLILPHRPDGMKGMVSGLTASKLDDWRGRLRTQKVKLKLPRFDGGSMFNLKEQLKALGMGEAFSRRADFSGMNGKKDLRIDEVVHKTFVSVAEKGTEAAAATAVVVGRKGAARPQRPMKFYCDRPFLYAIEDTETGAILFMGRMDDPTSKPA